MQLSPTFTLERLTFSYTAERRGIDNTPPEDVIENLKITAGYLEQVQTALGVELHLNDVYRCSVLNLLLGGSATSDHPEGLAADFTAPAFGGPKQVIEAIIAAGIPFDQLIYEGSWVHGGWGPRMRGQIETATFTPRGVVYSAGLA